MTDVALAALWIAVLGAALGGIVVLHRLGLATTYARDLLHVGTGVWVLGWPLWHGAALPVLITTAAALATASVPALARSHAWAGGIQGTFSGGDERWGGLCLYTASYAGLTFVGLAGAPFAAGAGLLALSLGDGIGGAVGRRFGTHRFRAPGGKEKSVEGSLAVAVAASAGVLLAAWRFGVHPRAARVVLLGAGAALAEALSPRGTDNVVVPAAVWALAELGTQEV